MANKPRAFSGRLSSANRIEVWLEDLKDGSYAAGLFNRGDAQADVALMWKNAKLTGKFNARDLWQHKDIGEYENEMSLSVPRTVDPLKAVVRISLVTGFCETTSGHHLRSSDRIIPAYQAGKGTRETATIFGRRESQSAGWDKNNRECGTTGPLLHLRGRKGGDKEHPEIDVDDPPFVGDASRQG